MLLKTKILIVFLFFNAVPALCFAQSALLEKGQSGIGIQAGATVGNGSMTVSALGMGCFKGIIDLGVFVGKEVQSDRFRSDPAYGFAGEFIFIKENRKDKIPLSISVFVIHSIAERQESETFGVSLYKKLKNQKGGFFQPFFSVYRIWPQTLGAKNVNVGTVGISIGTISGNAGLFNISASVSRIIDEYSYSITFGFIFGQFAPKSKRGKNFNF